MIDLSLVRKDIYKLIWTDGTELHLLPPTQKLYAKIQQISGLSDSLAVIDSIYDTTEEIINANTEHKRVENIRTELDLELSLMVIQDYFEFYQKQMEQNVVFRQSQQQNK